MCVCGVFMLRINSTTRWPSVTTIQCAFTINSGEILSRVRIRRRNGRVSLLWRALKKRSLAHNTQKQIKATTILAYYWTLLTMFELRPAVLRTLRACSRNVRENSSSARLKISSV